MEILVAIKKALKKAGVPEKYAAKVKALFNIESEENLENYVSLFKDNILPDLEASEQNNQNVANNAIAEYEKASGKGMPPATFRLAQIYDEGKGVGKNRKKALQLYKLAAKQGSIEAMEKIREFEKASLAK